MDKKKMRNKTAIIGVFLFLFCLLCVSETKKEDFREALYYKKLEGKNLQCELCPRKCAISENNTGYCKVRKNIEGKLYSLVYGKPVSIAVDPIEKKPVFHVLPGTKSFSLATVGCNMRCIHCQNWSISQISPEEADRTYSFSPEQIVEAAIKNDSKSISYTYTEPVVFYEYMTDIAKIAKKKGLKNIMVTSGWINQKPFKALCRYIDVARIDLKGFTDEFYGKLANATLEPILETIKTAKKEKVWVEIINLVIPGYNDDMDNIRKMCGWIKENAGPDTPLFFTRFQPVHKLTSVPPTPVETLERAKKTAEEEGLKFVYIGNVPGNPGESTYCPKCRKILIKRTGYFIPEINVIKGKCKYCGEKIPGIWK